MTMLAPYAGTVRTPDRRSLMPGYSRWLRSKWIERIGRMTPKDRWSPEEDRLASDMRSRGKTCGQIAFRLSRTPDAIAARLRLLRLREAQ